MSYVSDILIEAYHLIVALAYVAYCVEPAYTQMAALHSLTYDEMHHLDRLSDGVNNYIEKEFIKQRANLGDLCTESVIYQHYNRMPVLTKTISGLLPDFPLVNASYLSPISEVLTIDPSM